MARFFSLPARRRVGKLLLRHPFRAASPQHPASSWAGTCPAACVRDALLVVALAWAFHPEPADFRSFPRVQPRKSPRPEKIFAVYRSSWPPEFSDVVSRIRRARKSRKTPAFHTSEMHLVGKTGRALRPPSGSSALSFSGGTAQIRRTLGRTDTKLLKKSGDRPK